MPEGEEARPRSMERAVVQAERVVADHVEAALVRLLGVEGEVDWRLCRRLKRGSR